MGVPFKLQDNVSRVVDRMGADVYIHHAMLTASGITKSVGTRPPFRCSLKFEH